MYNGDGPGVGKEGSKLTAAHSEKGGPDPGRIVYI
jgi:hypothetical protein